MSIHHATTPEMILRMNELHEYPTCKGCTRIKQQCPHPGAQMLQIHERCDKYTHIILRQIKVKKGRYVTKLCAICRKEIDSSKIKYCSLHAMTQELKRSSKWAKEQPLSVLEHWVLARS